MKDDPASAGVVGQTFHAASFSWFVPLSPTSHPFHHIPATLPSVDIWEELT